MQLFAFFGTFFVLFINQGGKAASLNVLIGSSSPLVVEYSVVGTTTEIVSLEKWMEETAALE